LPSFPTPRRRPGVDSERRPLPAASLLATLAIAGVGLLAGCGSSGGSGTSADPAGAVPAASPIYAGADVRPQGAEKSGALAAGKSLTHQANPYLRLVQVLQTPGSPALDFGRDIAPWLGPHAGVFLSALSSANALLPLLEQGLLGSAPAAAAFPFGAQGAQGAVVLDTTDAAKARSFLDAQAAHAGARAAAYRGVSYQVTAAGVAFGLVDRFAVIGSESGLHGVIDTTQGGAPLARAAGYSKLLAQAPSGALAHLYTNPTGGQQARAPRGASGILGLLAGAREANISLVASSRSLSLYADTRTSAATGTPGGLLSSGAEGAHALQELPGSSWLAIGLGHLGSTLGADIAGLREIAALGTSLAGSGAAPSASSSPFELKALIEGLVVPLNLLGADTAAARRDFTSWMGSGGVFASGSGLLELKGAVVIESKNPTLSRAAVAKLASLLRRAGERTQTVSIPGTEAAVEARINGVPIALDIASGRAAGGQSRFVLGLGEPSVTEALTPSSTLAGATSQGTAAKALGEGLQPSLIFEVPTLLSLLEGVGLTADPTISKLIPYVRAIASVAGGGHALPGEIERFKLTLGLH
jgi:hypothetical protein